METKGLNELSPEVIEAITSFLSGDHTKATVLRAHHDELRAAVDALSGLIETAEGPEPVSPVTTSIQASVQSELKLKSAKETLINQCTLSNAISFLESVGFTLTKKTLKTDDAADLGSEQIYKIVLINEERVELELTLYKMHYQRWGGAAINFHPDAKLNWVEIMEGSHFIITGKTKEGQVIHQQEVKNKGGTIVELAERGFITQALF